MNELDLAIREKLANDEAWLAATHAGSGLDEANTAEVVAEHRAYQRALHAVLDRCNSLDLPGNDHNSRMMRAIAYVIRTDVLLVFTSAQREAMLSEGTRNQKEST